MTNGNGRPRLLLVVAHPDDETFGCGSLLLHAAATGMQTIVICATRGEAGEVVTAAPEGGTGDLGARRERELRAAADLLGVTRVELLDFRDSGMAGEATADTLTGAPLHTLRDQVRTLVDEVRPTIVVTLDGGDGHRDHARIRDATLAAVDAASWKVERVYLHCLPVSLMRRWVEHMIRVDPSWAHLSSDVPGTPDHLVTTVIDSAEVLEAREQAIALHVSQKSPYDGLPDDLRREFLTVEHLRQVRPPWTGAAPEQVRRLYDGVMP